MVRLQLGLGLLFDPSNLLTLIQRLALTQIHQTRIMAHGNYLQNQFRNRERRGWARFFIWIITRLAGIILEYNTIVFLS